MSEAAHDRSADRRRFILRAIYASCLLGATYNHAAAILQHGLFWDYGGYPRVSTTFWTVLVISDPAAVILLFARPNAGVLTTAAIIIVDVSHNVLVKTLYFPLLFDDLAGNLKMVEQIVFMIFVIVTAPLAWRAQPSNRL